eukprot:TRINITY_DN8129_c0_g1_i2.p1 TRINITY_DN8129_c0_g1~~TRINITY_DN8129_c0_g1_i2.p1  ORF type:complete len:309 (+),score=46.12 TRINITY_DN8129_c0_g1_i2:36-962(+)
MSVRYKVFCKTAFTSSRALAKLDPRPLPVEWARMAVDMIPEVALPFGGKNTTRHGLPCWELEGTDARNATKLVIYLHGGGYLMGSTKIIRGLVSRIQQKTGLGVLGVDYRLAPENPLPAAVDDAVGVYKELSTAGYSVCLAGDSAGGGLVLLALQKIRDEGLKMPFCAVAVSPFADLVGNSASFVKNHEKDVILGGFPKETFSDAVSMMIGNTDITGATIASNDPASPIYSPLYGSFTSLPPLKILVGTTEILLDDSLAVAEKASAQGVDVDLEIVPEMVHSCPVFTPMFPEATKGADSMSEFILKHI